jgi:hypothetical protein
MENTKNKKQKEPERAEATMVDNGDGIKKVVVK